MIPFFVGQRVGRQSLEVREVYGSLSRVRFCPLVVRRSHLAALDTSTRQYIELYCMVGN